MNNYPSPSSILISKYDMSFKESNLLIEEWLINHPNESHQSLSEYIMSGEVLLKGIKLSNVPQFTMDEAIELIETIKQSATFKISDQSYHFKKYENCFIGSELVSWIAENQNISSHDALLVGRCLYKLNLIKHVTNEHEFENKNLFYSFTLPMRNRGTDFSIEQMESLIQELQQSDTFIIKDRSYKLKTYPQCFLASDLVKWLRQNKKMITVDAVSLAQELIRNKYMSHVTNDHEFKNEDLFFRLNK